MLHSPTTPNGTSSITDVFAVQQGRSESRSPVPPSVYQSNGRIAVIKPPPSSWLPGSEVVAQYSFNGGSAEDLPFTKGQVLTIENCTQDPNWYIASNRKQHRGLIPANYVIPFDPGEAKLRATSNSNTNQMIWFHGKISRQTSEKLLSTKSDGTFLIRESTNFPGDYTLSLAFADKVEHYRIQREDGMLTCDKEEFFDNLTQLVSHYKRDPDGLVTRLITPLPCIKQYEGHDDTDAVTAQTRVFKDSGWSIHRHDLSLGDLIGHGEFGDVHVGWYREKKVAVKILKQCSGVLESLLSEAELMLSLRHTNLVQLIGVVLDDLTDVFMVTEYMANGNLVDYLRSRGRQQVEKLQMLQFAIDVCCGMAYLESCQLVHRDLAARNILLSEDMVANISDFGLAKHADTSSLDTSGKFPIKWTAPEALRHSPIQDVMRHIEKGYRMEPPEACPKPVAALMSKAWQLKPDDRPTFASMLEHMKSVRTVLKEDTTNSAPVTPTVPPLPPASLVPSSTVTITINDHKT